MFGEHPSGVPARDFETPSIDNMAGTPPLFRLDSRYLLSHIISTRYVITEPPERLYPAQDIGDDPVKVL